MVKVGKFHIKGLQAKNIPHAELYPDYSDFEAATAAKEVLANASRY